MIAAIIIVGGAFVVVEYGSAIPAQQKSRPSPAISASPGTTSIATADSDWQKVLVGAGVGNLAKKGSLGSGAAGAQSAPLTMTNKLGQMLVSGYLQLQQSGGDESTDTINSMVSQALNDPDVVPTRKVYSFSDIKIGKNDSVNAALVYAQNIITLFDNNNAVGNEAVYARDAVEQNDPTISAKIAPIIVSYKNILNGLLGMIVTPSIASIHLDLVNAMSERLFSAELLRVVNTDPAAGLEGAGEYLTGLQDLSNAFREIKQYFDTLKINFNATTASSSIPGLGI